MTLFKMSLVCVLMVGGTLALADDGQPRAGNGGRPDNRVQRELGRGQPPALPDSTQIVRIVEDMAKALKLTDAQKSHISDLHFAHFAAMKDRMGQAKGAREDHRKEMDALRLRFEDDVKALLNEEQKREFEATAKKRGPRAGQPNQQRR
jgi:hypothetical protein